MLVNPVSQAYQAAGIIPTQNQTQPKPQAAAGPQDYVQLSPQAKAAADHDGDTH